MFDKYKRDSGGRFAPTMSDKKNVPSVNQDAMAGAIEWRRTQHALREVMPAGISAGDLLPMGRNRNPKSGLFDGFVMLNGVTFEVKTRKHHSAQFINGFDSTHVAELYTTGWGKQKKISKPSEFRAVIEKR